MPGLSFFTTEKLVRARNYPPERDFLAWWEVVKTHVYPHVDMDGSARSAALIVAEKVKEAEKGPAARRVTVIEAQWWFCKEVSLSLCTSPQPSTPVVSPSLPILGPPLADTQPPPTDKQGGGNIRFHEVILMPEPHRRTRQFATLYRLERAQGFENADDIAAILAAGWDVMALGDGLQGDEAVVRLAPEDKAGGLTARELRDVVDSLVGPAVDLALSRLERAVQQGLQPSDRLVRERDVMRSLLHLRRAVPDDLAAAAAASPGAETGQTRPYFDNDDLISFGERLITLDDNDDDGIGYASPAPIRQIWGSESQPTGSWETWDD